MHLRPLIGFDLQLTGLYLRRTAEVQHCFVKNRCCHWLGFRQHTCRTDRIVDPGNVGVVSGYQNAEAVCQGYIDGLFGGQQGLGKGNSQGKNKKLDQEKRPDGYAG